MVIGVVKLEMRLIANITWSHDDMSHVTRGCGQLNLSHTMWKLVAIVLAKVEIKFFYLSRDHMTNESRDSLGEIPSP